MTHFLVTEDRPDGYRLEDILILVRKDMLTRALKIADDRRPEAIQVMRNNMKILGLLSEAIAHAEDSTRILDKAFGNNAKGGPPRIGKAGDRPLLSGIRPRPRLTDLTVRSRRTALGEQPYLFLKLREK